mgnify:FL=1|tara:strand:- start:2648 stop:3733 length:1086 start_codon:yes stop_codon:yes gene_type:complete
MGAYKQLNSQDLIVSPFEVNKGFHFIGGDALTGSNVGIDRYIGANGDYLISGSELTGNIEGQQIPKVLVYDSIKTLYYGNYISGSGGFLGEANTSSIVLGANEAGDRRIGQVETTNFYDYSQTTLWPNRGFPTASLLTSSVEIGVVSIPSKLFGDYIQPQSFLFQSNESGSIGDDGEGRLWYNFKPVNSQEIHIMAGNIIYEHGIITLFNNLLPGQDSGEVYGESRYGTDLYGSEAIATELFLNAFITSSNVTMSFSSSYKLFETQYQLTFNEDEFNYSTNPTIVTGSTFPNNFSLESGTPSPTASYGNLLDFATSSYFEPYVTTVGLYDNDFNLLAVGKLGKPLQTSAVTDTTILVNIDR